MINYNIECDKCYGKIIRSWGFYHMFKCPKRKAMTECVEDFDDSITAEEVNHPNYMKGLKNDNCKVD